MNYKIVNIRTTASVDPVDSVLIIYTGGTFGMAFDEAGSLAPFNFGRVIDRVPELRKLELKITVISFPEPRDSSNINYTDWQDMAYIIYENYDQYDGFVILHGTDTMAYSASALSYMLQGLNKPVIFTGAQIPIGSIRSDARENLITALEIASAKNGGVPMVNEVCIYFNYYLLRGNRSQKIRSSTFAAFQSQNYPYLAESGIEIEYRQTYMMPHNPTAQLSLKRNFDENVVILKIFPSMSQAAVESFFKIKGLKGVVLETYGSGNTMNFPWFLKVLEKAIKKGIIVYNVSQCSGGEVIQGRYETSKRLNNIGVLSGGDITTEAAVTKLMFLLGNEEKQADVRRKLVIPLNGEMDN
ncbi:asparaginase [Marinoscillum furvescens]|uniref:asparaginase n=1 Tax=Marinoscillum furvescens DSM 4134 TaxID=1122208 RepID=A0A3D9LIN6_MARFU|nr:asparaginase [Marinoscillum furvescens]REE05725.1 asparaginase [Marinoscillum furvescens DSM 4134]